jgi:hypothetical protein
MSNATTTEITYKITYGLTPCTAAWKEVSDFYALNPNQTNRFAPCQSIGVSVVKTVRLGLLLKYTGNVFIICKYMLGKTIIIFRADPFTF